MARFEWDPEKDIRNLAKHGISFDEAKTIFDGPVLSLEDERQDDEARERSFGLVRGVVVLCVVHTLRGEVTRIISARKATRRERALFDEHYR
jgi:uncharacterized DUF497 family protein